MHGFALRTFDDESDSLSRGLSANECLCSDVTCLCDCLDLCWWAKGANEMKILSFDEVSLTVCSEVDSFESRR